MKRGRGLDLDGKGDLALVALIALGGVMLWRPRGVKNNNPGNLKKLGAWKDWKGLSITQTDPVFIQFKTAHDGLRAMARTLYNYRARHGMHTVKEFVARWATEKKGDDTSNYAKGVAADLGISADSTPRIPEDLPALVAAFVRQENGRQLGVIPWYTSDTIKKAVADSLMGV